MNKGQNDGYSKDFSVMYDNLQERIESFGWDCRTIDGHDMEEIRETLNSIDDKPLCIIMDTIKGKGVSFMENNNYWHSGILKKEEFDQAISELSEKI